MPGNHNEIEKRLVDAADELRANSALKSSEYSVPVLGLIFLRYADHKFSHVEKELAEKSTGRRKNGKTDYQARGVMYLPEKARFSTLLNLPEGADIGKAINAAMKAIEDENEELKGVLPRNYAAFENDLLFTLLKNFASIPIDIEGDVFGKIYEYFLGKFAMAEGSKGGEFFTPTSLVRLIVEVIEPFHGRIFDPADGSGGMFVQSARFVQSHAKRDSLTSGPSPSGRGNKGEGVGIPADMISIYGQDRVAETVRLCKMNLAVHGLSGDIREGNTYYEDIHESVGKFDFVMANPPFNVDKVDKERLANDPRFPFGLPKPDNANYLWIQIFYSALNPTGRAGFVMANSASDARGSEMEIRRKLIEAGVVDVMIAIGSNFFYTVTLPCTLWFMDKAKAKLPPCPPSPGSLNHPLPKVEGRGGFRFQGLVEQARELRKRQTPAEEALWQLLRNRQLADLKFRRQHQIGDYIVDFFCAEYGLVVELDGGVHDTSDRRNVDKKRDAYLRSLGHTVLRFSNARVFDDTEGLLGEILRALPSTPGRGVRGEGLPENVLSEYKGSRYSDTVLFIDARHIFRQIDRAHREFSSDQIGFLANIVRLYRGETPDFTLGGDEAKQKLLEIFGAQPSPRSDDHPSPTGRGIEGEGAPTLLRYRDVLGLARVPTISEIEQQSWSLNPGRYVGVSERPPDDFDFKEKLEELNEELEALNTEAREFEDRIAENVAKLLE